MKTTVQDKIEDRIYDDLVQGVFIVLDEECGDLAHRLKYMLIGGIPDNTATLFQQLKEINELRILRHYV